MGVTVRQALSIGGLTRARVVGGSSGLDRIIKYVDIIEVPDFSNWLRPNVFSITCAYAIRDNRHAQVNLVRHSAQCDAAGLAVKPGRFLGSMPEEMVKAADEEGMPLLELPEDLPYIEITHPLQSVILDEEMRDSRYRISVHRTIVDLMVRQGGIESIVEALSKLLERNVYVLDEGMTVIASCQKFAGRFAGSGEVQAWADSLARMASSFPLADRRTGPDALSTWSCEQADVFRVEVPLDQGRNAGDGDRQLFGFVAVDAGGKSHLRFAEAATAYQAAIAIGLEISSVRLRRDASRRIMTEFLNEVLGSTASPAFEQVAAAKASLLGLDLDRPFVVAVMKALPVPAAAAPEFAGSADAEAASSIGRYLDRAGRPLGIRAVVTAYDPGIVAILMPDEPGMGLSEAAVAAAQSAPWHDPSMNRIMSLLRGIDSKHVAGPDFAAGVSSVEKGVSGIVRGYSEAIQALTLNAHAGGRFSVTRFDHTSPYMLLQGLGKQQLESYYNAILGRLDGDGDLLNTLRVFLEHGCQATQAASCLFVHRNTLAYRLKSIEKKLCCDLGDPEVQLRLRLAILAGTLTGKSPE